MSEDRVVQTYLDTDAETRDPMYPYQSTCMSRYGSSSLPTLEHDHITLGDASKGGNCDNKHVLVLAPIVEHEKAPTLPVYEIPNDTFIPEPVRIVTCEEDQMIRKSTVCSKSRGNAWPGHLGLLPEFEYHGEHKVVLSSKDNQGKDGAGDQAGSLGTDNESSTDTDIMDSKVFQTRNNFLGVVDSTPLVKDAMVGQIPTKFQVVSPSQEVGRRKREFKLPDMNEMPPCSGSESAMENMISFSTSTTESLDMEHLHSQVVNVEKLASNPHQKTPQGLDSGNKWVKRIKNSRSEDVSYTENINTPLNKNMDNNRTTIEPTASKHLGEKHMELGKNMMLSRNREPSSMLTVKEQRHQTLSHSWIRRLCHNVDGTRTIKPSGDPQRSNAALDALESRQLPSIATMALMGKVMNGFKTCEFKNKGSFVVWGSREV